MSNTVSYLCRTLVRWNAGEPLFSLNSSLENTCHMTSFVIELSYDKERTHNDGRRTSSIATRAGMELVYTQVWQSKVLLCSQMEAESGLHCLGVHFVENYTGGCAKETSSNKISLDRSQDSVVARLVSYVFQTTETSLSSRYLASNDNVPCGNCQGSGRSAGETRP